MRSYFEILDSAAATIIPETTDLTARILSQIGMKSKEAGKAATFPSKTRSSLSGLKKGWVLAVILFTILLAGILIAGPQEVYAALNHLFGYIPGIGIVEEDHSLRILAKPVQVTRQGITVSINQVILTHQETRVNYGIMGVPLSAYSNEGSNSGCIEREYLRLPDGSRSEINAPISPDVNEAVFILPCIPNTLPGSAPTGWEIPLQFIPASSDFKILPVEEVTQPPIMKKSQSASEPAATEVDPQPSDHARISVDQVIPLDDSTILMGTIKANLSERSRIQITGGAFLRDADGNPVNYRFPDNIQPNSRAPLDRGDLPWAIQIRNAGLKYPLTIGFAGVILTQEAPTASARLSVDVGNSPIPGQILEINQPVQIAHLKFKLASISVIPGGYSFRIEPTDPLSSVSIEIEGHPAVGAGGGGTWRGAYSESLVFDVLPQGHLNLIFSNPISASPLETWTTAWTPGFPTVTPQPAGVDEACWSESTIQNVPPLPQGLDGRVIITKINPDLQIIFSSLNGSQQKIIARDHARAALSPDGSRLAFSTEIGIEIHDLNSGAVATLKGVQGRDLHWSPDGSKIAMALSGELFGIFVTDLQGTIQRQITRLGNESIAGWSPDGAALFYAIPGPGLEGSFQLFSVDVSSGEIREEFELEDSSRKAPLPALSPDGKWIAYRSSENNSLYLKNMDASPSRLLLDQTGAAITGISWEKEGYLLGVSLVGLKGGDKILLLAPDSCETYQLPGLSGELDGVVIP